MGNDRQTGTIAVPPLAVAKHNAKSRGDRDAESAATTFTSSFGSFDLVRSPRSGGERLQAWDGADRLLLSTAAEHLLVGKPQRVLLVGDRFGALTLATAAWQPSGWTDSAVSVQAIAHNAARNGVVVALPEPPPSPPYVAAADAVEPVDLVLWHIPRNAAYLQRQAAAVRAVVGETTTIVAAGLDKHLPTTARQILTAIGSTTTLPGAHKAHAFRVRPAPAVDEPTASEPVAAEIPVPEFGLRLDGGINVFSADRIDLGARVMLGAIDRLTDVRRIADLGCGNGVLGLAAKRRLGAASVAFFDESSAAIEVTLRNASANFDADVVRDDVSTWWTDGMHAYEGEGFDLILCNPPFHEQGAVTDETAWSMFSDARDHLLVNGELWVVGNRHLNYHLKLQRLFGNCAHLSGHPKYVVLRAVKRAR